MATLDNTAHNVKLFAARRPCIFSTLSKTECALAAYSMEFGLLLASEETEGVRPLLRGCFEFSVLPALA